jgi:hypothetical protein
MLARSGRLPTSGDFAYEVKWDGFRAIVSTEGPLRVRSRRGWDMTPQVGFLVLPVVEVGVERLHRRSPPHSRTDQGRGEDLTDVALLDQVTHVSDRGRGAGLQTRHGEDTLFLCQCGQRLGLVQAVAERPLAVDGLARIERRGRQLEVIRHLPGARDDVHGRAADEVLVIVEGGRHAEERPGSAGSISASSTMSVGEPKLEICRVFIRECSVSL